jgi:hypothetical protein
MGWAIINAKLNWSEVQTWDEAVRIIREAWDGIEISVVNRLCASFAARVELMIEAGWQTIQPLLGSHRQRVPAGYLSDRPHLIPPPPWTLQEEEDLMRLRAPANFSGRHCIYVATSVSALCADTARDSPSETNGR